MPAGRSCGVFREQKRPGSQADEADGLAPGNEDNTALRCFCPEKPYCPLHTEGTERAEQRNVLESICQRECYQQGYRDCITLLKMLGILA